MEWSHGERTSTGTCSNEEAYTAEFKNLTKVIDCYASKKVTQNILRRKTIKIKCKLSRPKKNKNY